MNVETYLKRLKDAAKRAGFTISYYGKVSDLALPVLERHSGENRPEVYISSGVHGDEPAAPMAVLELLRKGLLPDAANYTIFPIVNPCGPANGTRENPHGVDLNRDYGPDPVAYETRAQLAWIGDRKFSLNLCLHEDYDGEGFYVYAHAKDPHGPDYPGLAIAAAEPFTGIDRRTEIDGMPAKNGRMFPPVDVMDRNRTDLPEALRFIWMHGSQLSITTETPSCQPIANRIAAQCAVVKTVIAAFLR